MGASQSIYRYSCTQSEDAVRFRQDSSSADISSNLASKILPASWHKTPDERSCIFPALFHSLSIANFIWHLAARTAVVIIV